jgi:uncharacterized DUF497 family protein
MEEIYRWYNFYTEKPEFEIDSMKSLTNKEKHGIDFVEAQHLWSDPERLLGPARSKDEPRQIVIGKIREQHWSAIVTPRGERVRIISVRKARKKEISRYEDQGQGSRREV